MPSEGQEMRFWVLIEHSLCLKKHGVNKKDFKYKLEKKCHIWWRTQCNLLKSIVKGMYWKYLSAHTGILSASQYTAKCTAPRPHDNGKAAQTIQESMGSNRDFIQPYHWPCAYHETFHNPFYLNYASVLYKELIILNLTLWPTHPL